MPHIHTGPGEHDHTISAYIIRIDGSEPKILLHRHKRFNRIMQFGGHVELKQHPWQTMSNELLEETGYELSQLRLLQPKIRLKKVHKAILHPYPVSYATHDVSDTHNHIDISYAFVTSEKPKQKIKKGESSEIKLYTKADVKALDPQETYENFRDIALFIFDECLKEWEAVPADSFEY